MERGQRGHPNVYFAWGAIWTGSTRAPRKLKMLKNVQNIFLASVGTVAVIGSIIVVVPYSEVDAIAQKRLHFGDRTAMCITIAHTCAAVPIRFAQIYIVAEPHHEVRFLLVNGIKNLIITSIRLARSVGSFFIYISTTAQSDFEGRRLCAILPQSRR